MESLPQMCIRDRLYGVARGGEPSGNIGPLSLREYAANMTAPHRMDLMVSSMLDREGKWNCSLKCRHCYAAGQPAAGTEELSAQEWFEIIDRCRRAGICQLTFTGGEPTMREDLPELVEHARWFVTRLNTNGARLTGELCRKLYDASLDSVQITLYSENAEIHNHLTGADLPDTEGSFKKTVLGLRNALEAGLNVSVNTPLCRENREYIRTLAFLYQNGVRYVTCSGLIETGKAMAEASLSSQLTVEEMNALLREAMAFCSQHGMELSFTSPGRADPAVLKELGLAVPMCGACLSNMAVAPDGSVVPCQSWLSGSAPLGNMLTDSWKRIWNHPACLSLIHIYYPEDNAYPNHIQRPGAAVEHQQVQKPAGGSGSNEHQRVENGNILVFYRFHLTVFLWKRGHGVGIGYFIRIDYRRIAERTAFQGIVQFYAAVYTI